MQCELLRTYRFEAAHRLPRVPDTHKCSRVHGHSYRIGIRVVGPVDPAHGWVMDFAALDTHVDPLIARLDHRLLNDIEGLDNPTSERLAMWLWEHLRPQLPLLTEVSVAETESSQCIYRGPS